MAKTVITTRVDDTLLDNVRAIGERQRWTFTTAVEVALEDFVARYGQLPLPVPPAAPVAEPPRVVVINGVTYTPQEMVEAA